MKAVTDAGPTEPNSVKPEPIANLFTMMEIVSTKDTFDFFNEKYNNCEIRYGDLKSSWLKISIISVLRFVNVSWTFVPTKTIWQK